MKRTLIYAINEGMVYGVIRTDDKWYYGKPTMEIMSFGNKSERAFLKDGANNFHIVSSDLAKQLVGKSKVEVIKLLLNSVCY